MNGTLLAACIAPVRVHDLRQSFASIAAAPGALLQLIGRLLGHTSQQTTGRFAHFVAAQVRDANAAVGDALAGRITRARGRGAGWTYSAARLTPTQCPLNRPMFCGAA